ncbi:MAG: cysteine--tRNA ligase [Bacillota bacterium]
MKFSIYNTLEKQKVDLVTEEDGKVKLYTCGPTVYDFAHIGNLRTYVFEDLLVKSLEYVGYEVKHVMNVTDVGHLESDADTGEDKMLLGAQRENRTVWEIARYYEEQFFIDCEKLNIRKPDVISRATEHIQDMIDLVKVLEEKGYTYISNGNVYFEIDKFKDYTRLANLTIEELQAGSRVDIDTGKKNPLDFVLWFTNSKFKNQIMQWNSPWGTGFPGWHLECSAMAMKYLGEKVDIHCGGVDHIPVHHTNEIAQSEAALGHKWVNYWMHGEFLVLDSGKMSKSSGDFLTLSKLEENGFKPIDYRYFCLQSRYRKQLVFSYESLKEASNAYKSLKKKIKSIADEAEEIANTDVYSEKIISYKNEFIRHISNDLNIPNAVTVLWDVLKDAGLSAAEKKYLIADFDKVLSLDLLLFEEAAPDNMIEELISSLIAQRNEERKNKNYQKADEIRNKLLKMNIEILDTKEGTTWRLKN